MSETSSLQTGTCLCIISQAHVETLLKMKFCLYIRHKRMSEALFRRAHACACAMGTCSAIATCARLKDNSNGNFSHEYVCARAPLKRELAQDAQQAHDWNTVQTRNLLVRATSACLEHPPTRNTTRNVVMRTHHAQVLKHSQTGNTTQTNADSTSVFLSNGKRQLFSQPNSNVFQYTVAESVNSRS